MKQALTRYAGHDNGLIVFKLERERPAFSLSGNQLFYVKDKVIRMADLTTGTNQGVCSVRKLGSQWVQPRTLSYNPAERSVLVTTVRSTHAFLLLLIVDMLTPSSGPGERPVRACSAAQGYCSHGVGWQRRGVGRKEGHGIQCNLCRPKPFGSARQDWPGA